MWIEYRHWIIQVGEKRGVSTISESEEMQKKQESASFVGKSPKLRMIRRPYLLPFQLQGRKKNESIQANPSLPSACLNCLEDAL